MTDSGLAVAGLWVCLFGPSVVVAGHAGLLVDRIEATRLLAGVSLFGAVVAAVLGFTTGTAAVLALTALLGLVFAILQPAEFALVPPLAGQTESRRRTATSRRPATWASASVPARGAALLGRWAGAGDAGRCGDLRGGRRRGAGTACAARSARPRGGRAHATRPRRGRLPVPRPGAIAGDDGGLQLAAVHVRRVGRRAVLRQGRARAGRRRLRADAVDLDGGDGAGRVAAVAAGGRGRGGGHWPCRGCRPGHGPGAARRYGPASPSSWPARSWAAWHTA